MTTSYDRRIAERDVSTSLEGGGRPNGLHGFSLGRHCFPKRFVNPTEECHQLIVFVPRDCARLISLVDGIQRHVNACPDMWRVARKSVSWKGPSDEAALCRFSRLAGRVMSLRPGLDGGPESKPLVQQVAHCRSATGRGG